MKKSSFVEGTIIATLAIVITKILGMLYVIPFYAMVGIQGSALYAYAYNIYIIFLDISSAGLPIAISKLINEYDTLGQLDAKQRAYEVGKKLIGFISTAIFIALFIFAKPIATMIIGSLEGGNTIEDVAFVIRCVSFALLVIPYLSVTRGYLQGHNIISISSISQIIEQVMRIIVILGGSYLGVKVLHLSLRNTIGIAVFGAFVGGLFALLYIASKMKQAKEQLTPKETVKKDEVTNKEIANRLVSYAIPFIIIDIAASIYSFIDMVLILRTMNYIGLDATNVEFITTAITTWSAKISMIVNSMAMGMSISLIPAIVSAYTLKKWNDVNSKLNKALQMIIIISLPMVLGLSLLSSPVWSVFYGAEKVAMGSTILKVHIFVSLIFNIYVITSNTLQSLNKFKSVYISTITGFLTNALLDVPLMLLFNKLGWPPYLGAIIATMLGYGMSVLLALKILNKEHALNYTATLKTIGKLIIPTISMVVIVCLLKMLLPLDIANKFSCIIYIAVISIVGALTYLYLSYKMGILQDVFGITYLKKIVKKLTFGKVSL